MKDMLDKVVEYGWDHEDCEGVEEAVIATCMTYKDIAQLVLNLLEWGCGKFDDRVCELVCEMVGEYLDDECPQPPAEYLA